MKLNDIIEKKPIKENWDPKKEKEIINYFLNEYYNAIKTKDLTSFEEALRKVDENWLNLDIDEIEDLFADFNKNLVEFQNNNMQDINELLKILQIEDYKNVINDVRNKLKEIKSRNFLLKSIIYNILMLIEPYKYKYFALKEEIHTEIYLNKRMEDKYVKGSVIDSEVKKYSEYKKFHFFDRAYKLTEKLFEQVNSIYFLIKEIESYLKE